MSDNPDHCIINLYIDTPLISADRPTLPELLELLSTLVNWEAFAQCLPGVTTSFIDKIKEEYHSSQQKEAFFRQWLEAFCNASWRHVVIALNKTQNDTLFRKVLTNLTTKELPTSVKRITTPAITSDNSKLVTTLQSDFKKLTTSFKRKLNELIRDGKETLAQIVNSIQEYLSIELPPATSIKKLFTELQPYNNYVNCGLLEHLKKKFTLEKHVLNTRITKYSKQLQEFLISYQLEHVAPAIQEGDETTQTTSKTISYVTLILVRKKWSQLSLHNLIRATEYCFGSSVKLHLNHIKLRNKIICVTFSIPHSHVKLLRSFTNINTIHQLGIVRVNVDGETFVPTQDEIPSFEESCLKSASVGNYMSLLALLELGVSVDCTNDHGQTPLMLATINGQELVIRILALVGANMNITDTNGCTALMIASANGNSSLVDLLLQNNADRSIETADGHTASSLAKQNGHISLLQNFLECPTTQDVSQPQDEHRQLFELLIKEQQPFSQSLMRIKDESIKNDRKLALFMRHVKENDTLLEELRTSLKTKDQNESSSPEYFTLKEKLGHISDMLAGNPETMVLFSDYLQSFNVIPVAVHRSVSNVHNPSDSRSSKLLNSVLTNLQGHSNPNEIFTNFIVSLHKVKLSDMAFILTECLKKKGGDVQIKEGDSSALKVLTKEKPIELSPGGIVATQIEKFRFQFNNIVFELKERFDTLIEEDTRTLKKIVRRAGKVPSDIENVDKLFESLSYDFFSFGVLKDLVQNVLLPEDQVRKELMTYDQNILEFSNSTKLKEFRSALKEQLAESSTVENNEKVVIKLDQRWEDLTIDALKNILKHYFGKKTSDNFHHIRLDYGSLCVMFFVPKGSYSQSVIDNVTSKQDSMNRVGVFNVAVNENTLLEKEENMNFDNSLLHSATFGDNFEAKLLLQLGADPESTDENGRTALILATENGHTEIGSLLVSGGANPHATDNQGRSASTIAKERNNTKLMERFEQEKTVTYKMTFRDIFVKGQNLLLKELIDRETDVSSKLQNGSTPLILAVKSHHFKTVELLLNEKVDVNLQDAEGKTALIIATERDHLLIVQLLIKHEQINPSILDNKGYAALHYACQNGSTAMTSLLTTHDDAYCLTASGNTPLMIASEHGHLPIIELLKGQIGSIGDVLHAMRVSRSQEVMDLLNTFIKVKVSRTSD